VKGIPDEIVALLRECIAEREQRLQYIPSAGLRREHQADLDGKRLIVGWCAEAIGDRDLSAYGEPGALEGDPDALAVALAVETLRALALPFQTYPGYRAEWRQ
jgi:hypothetical protein